MDPSSEPAWRQLSAPWQAALTEAWASWSGGNLGIGAVLVDEASGEIVARGRNRVATPAEAPGQLGGNFMAHAEMNALAAMNRFKADGLHLYTTLEPCLMCAATTVFMHVDTVSFAAADEFFADVDELWQHHPYSARWQPARIGPLEGPVASFSRLLPLVLVMAENPSGRVAGAARAANPLLTALASDLAADGSLRSIADDGGSVEDALDVVVRRLQT